MPILPATTRHHPDPHPIPACQAHSLRIKHGRTPPLPGRPERVGQRSCACMPGQAMTKPVGGRLGHGLQRVRGRLGLQALVIGEEKLHKYMKDSAPEDNEQSEKQMNVLYLTENNNKAILSPSNEPLLCGLPNHVPGWCSTVLC